MKTLNYLIVLFVIIMSQHACQALPKDLDTNSVQLDSTTDNADSKTLEVVVSTVVDDLILKNQVKLLSLMPIARRKNLYYGRQPRVSVRKRKCQGRCGRNIKTRKSSINLISNNYYDLDRLINPERKIIDHNRRIGRQRFWNT